MSDGMEERSQPVWRTFGHIFIIHQYSSDFWIQTKCFQVTSDPIFKHANRHSNLQSSVWSPRIYSHKSCKAECQDVSSPASLGRGHFSLSRCIGGRVGRGVQTIPGLYGLAHSILVWFSPNDTQNYRS